MKIQLQHLLTLALFAAPASAGGDPTFTFVDLGTLGGPESVAYGLNDLRQVVGWSHLADCTLDGGAPCRRAYLWDDGTMADLGLLAGDEESFARAINNLGTIVGTSESDIVAGSGIFHGVVWTGGPPTALPDLGQGVSFAHDVNDAGQISGHTQDGSFLDRAVIWEGGAIANVGSTEPHTRNRAMGISEAGRLAGFAWELFQPNDAILRDGGAWFTIGGQAGPFQNAEAWDVNDSGVACGLQAFPSGAWHATLWTKDQPGGTDLGTLPGLDTGELYDVNEAGQAVGRSYDGADPTSSRAVWYDGTTLRDLNDFLPAGVNAVLFEAREINEVGDIAGTAVVDGLFRAFLMTRDDGTFEGLGNATPGTSGTPALVGQGALEGGTATTLTTTDALPGTWAFMILGFSQIDFPVYGGVLVPNPEFYFGPLVTDGTGTAVLSFSWPVNLPAGLSTYWQNWILDASGPAGWTISNGLRATTH